MNIRKAAKKIVALGSGAGMVAATLVGALAFDLSDHPDAFMDGDQFNGKIVVGENADARDIIGAIDLAAAFQAASTTEVAVGDGSSTTVVEGDNVKIGESSDLLEIGEYIGDVRESLDSDDLDMLMDGRVTTSKGSTKFTQTLELDPDSTNDSGRVLLDEDEYREEGFFLFFKGGQDIFNYDTEFTSGLESDVEDNVAEDLEDETIFMLGKEYSIVKATVSDAEALTLELIAGDIVDTLEEGQSKTYTVTLADGTEKDYEITLLVVGSSGAKTQAKFLVNGEVTDAMDDGDTDTLSDGTEIGIREVLQSDRNYEGDTGSVVEFYLGANKIEFDVSATGAIGKVDINRERIDDADVVITYSSTVTTGDGDISISSIQYTLQADGAKGSDVYIGPGEGLREQLDEPEGMLNEDWDIMFMGLSEPSMTEINFIPQGDDEYEFEFTNIRGQEFRVPYAAVTGATSQLFGDSDGDLFWFWESYADLGNNSVDDSGTFLIDEDDYFLLTDDDVDNDGKSWILQFDDVDPDDKTITLTLMSTGESVEATFVTVYNASSADGISNTSGFFGTPSGDIQLGGNDYSFWLRLVGGDYTMAVDQDNDDAVAGVSAFDNDAGADSATDTVNVVVKGGGVLTLSNETPEDGDGAWSLTMTALAEDIDSDVAQTVSIPFTTALSEFDLDLPSTATSGTWYVEDIKDQDEDWGVNAFGAWFVASDETSQADSLTIHYPSEQREALVYVVGGDVSSSSVTSGNTATRLNVLPVGLAVVDRDISVDEDNLIVVGGPCANTIAAELLGNPSDCTEGFEPGMGMIRSFDTGDNVALLVAGFNAEDTVRTSQLLAEATRESNPDFVGEALEVSWPSNNEPVVRAAMSDEE